MYSGIPSRRTLFEGASGEMYPGGLLRPHSRVICEGAELVEETWVGVVDLGGAHSRGSSSAFFFFFSPSAGWRSGRGIAWLYYVMFSPNQGLLCRFIVAGRFG